MYTCERMSVDVTLMRACSVLFLFRALAAAEDDDQKKQIEGQLLRFIRRSGMRRRYSGIDSSCEERISVADSNQSARH
jgi:hypothetical protein